MFVLVLILSSWGGETYDPPQAVALPDIYEYVKCVHIREMMIGTEGVVSAECVSVGSF